MSQKSYRCIVNAGRGVAIPKNDAGELRPIVVGHVLLRLIGSLAMPTLSGDIQRYFLQPDSVLQFGVGVQGGCELMAMAIATHMEEHPDHVDISCDARNAFNTWCRTRLWGTLKEQVPSIYALVKLMYGEAADVIFYEDGVGGSSTPWDPARAAALALSCTAWQSIPICNNLRLSTLT